MYVYLQGCITACLSVSLHVSVCVSFLVCVSHFLLCECETWMIRQQNRQIEAKR